MRTVIIGLAMGFAMGLSSSLAVAGGWGGTATVTCGNANRPVLNLTYSTGSDIGTPGLLGVGVMLPDMSNGMVFANGQWSQYEGGLYPFAMRFDNGFPGTVELTIPFPGSAYTTAQYQGYSVFVGHGAYTAEARRQIETVRASLARTKANLLPQGKWTAQMESATGPDSELRHIWSLIQKDGTDNQKFGAILLVPFVDCTPYKSSSSN